MNKKSFIIVSVFFIVLFAFASFVSANNDVKNAVSNTTDAVIDGVSNLGNNVRNGLGNVENGIEDALTMNNSNNDNSTTTMTTRSINDTRTTAGDYTATTTANDIVTDNNTYTLWIWLVIAIAAIIIIGLVWFYGNQKVTHHDD